MSDPKSTPIQSDLRIARHRAVLARFIATVFSEPSPPYLSRLSESAVRNELFTAANSIGLDARWIKAILDAHAADHEKSDTYVRLLGHTVRGECPPYELEYRAAEVFQQSQTLADIAGFYRAFGFQADGPLTERGDHVTAQWEFLAALSMMESLAPDADQATCCIEAQRSFLRDHAAYWMPAFFGRIRRTASESFLARAADLAEAILNQWCEALNINVGPSWLELRPVEEEDSTITCGAPGTVEIGPTLAAAMEGQA